MQVSVHCSFEQGLTYHKNTSLPQDVNTFLLYFTLARFEPVSCRNDNFNKELKFCFLEAYGENEGDVQKLQLDHQGRLGFQTAAE